MGMEQNPTGKKLKKHTLAWIEKHPELVERIERLQEISEDPESDLETLEAAERAVMDEIERLGGLALEGWMKSRELEARAASEKTPGLRKHSKKNSGSQPCSER